MSSITERFIELGVRPADIMIPREDVDLKKWAVVACDQYTSEKDYWKDVEEYVGDSPSTLKLIFPECYLEDGDSEQRIKNINSTMASYMESGLFKTYENCFFLVKRTCGNTFRLGLMAALDLDRYSWDKDSKSLIRATEGTILSRIPPRKAIRKDAGLEIPHIMVLISDAKEKIIENLYAKKDQLEKVYETDLMKNGGKVEAYLVNSEKDLESVLSSFEKLTSDLDKSNPLLFAMGDGNHSFATAKSCWEDIKQNLSEEERKTHPARFCLVELENIFDPGLVFESIHRVLFNVPEDVFISELEKVADGIEYETVNCKNCIASRMKDQSVQGFGYCTEDKHVYVRVKKPKSNIAAGTIQRILDSLIGKGYQVDYIHGLDVTDKLGSEKGNIGIFLPAIDKATFFETIIKDGALPRKTFSMGEADEKRYYMECRKIK